MKNFTYIVIGVIVVAVAVSFFVIGTPGTERLRRFDDVRVNHLSTIQDEIVDFWTKKDRLPLALNELQNDTSYFNVPRDPETNAEYGYRVLGQYQFELCANFTTDNEGAADSSRIPKSVYPYGYEVRWSHSIGQKCFRKNIDPELYKTDARKMHVPPVPSSL